MNTWWFIGFLTIITFFVSILLVYPLRRNALISCLLVPVILGSVAIGYYFWGSFAQWQHYVQQSESQKRAQAMLQSIKSPQELIDKLKAKLDNSPQSARGWYLLGRLYSSQKDNQHAVASFAKAHQLQPENEQFTVNYALSLWQMNKQQFTPQIITIFKTLLDDNPNQPDALSMLAMNAFLNHAYDEAIDYWQQLLKIIPAQSEEALMIHKAIAKAQEYHKG